MRAPPLLLLLLMAAAGLAVSPLARLNPWLSACDLEVEATSDQAFRNSPCGSSGAVPYLAKHDVTQLCAVIVDTRRTNLTQLRLRTCSERSPASALDNSARAHVEAGGKRCEETLRYLIDLDEMVARVHCEFVDILERYDCDQSYSVHTCKECQETYRKWACSTMLPLWVEDSKRPRRAPAEHAARWRARHLERVGHLDRRRGRGVVGRWVRAAAAGPGRPAETSSTDLVRLKPCLSVCQLVEQHCPYFLPADRAPAYPTQYAGEPTFLCLDERIPETGAQANKSNYGSDECCYWYCDERLCNDCTTQLPESVWPEVETCAAAEERVPGCSVPYQASSASPAARPPVTLPALLMLALLLLKPPPRTHWTLSTSLVNVRDSRL